MKSSLYPKDIETKIGFESLRQILKNKCAGDTGRLHVDEMHFSCDFNSIRHDLLCVKEMIDVEHRQLSLLDGAIPDVLGYLNELKAVSSFLAADKLYKIIQSLETIDAVYKFFNSADNEESNVFPELAMEFSDIYVFPDLRQELSRCINKYGEVKDNASPELSDIRRTIRSEASSVQSAMRRIMERAVNAGIIDKDTTPSMRDGRMVIPVVTGKKRSISGIVHDESATGKTVFIEPTEVVEASNRLKELELEEKREVTRILIQLADLIRPYIYDLFSSCRKLGKLDFIRAKARFAVEINGEMPSLHEKPEIEWYHAVHPALLISLRKQNREVVPLNIKLGGDKRILIISGPNAGGKSVCLKTVATVQYMMQCGILPSMYSNSHMGIFDKIFIDIGDEQSFESDLSTYSSHLKNMKYFMQNANDRTLLLADEMGSGTEPQIGGALAQAILHELGESGCFGVITTHYQNLKKFADSEAGFVNGAMLYDRQHLQPTFELSIGSPGSSFALDIASKIGLKKSILDNAREIVGSEYVNIDKYLSEISRDRRYWANKRLSIKEKERKLNSLLEQYEDTSKDLISKRNEIIREAKREAKEILGNTNAKIEKTIRDIRSAEAEKERTKELRKELKEYEESLKLQDNEVHIPSNLKPLKHKSKKKGESKKQSDTTTGTAFSVGDYVKMSEGGVVGKILSISGKKADVAFGSLRTQVALDRLVASQKPKETAQTQVRTISRSTEDDIRRRQLNFNTDIDVRGMRTDEALQAVTYFIDDALQFNAGRVRILHGTGEGILKTMIRKMLATIPAVTSMRDEDVRFGGAGITIVDLE